MTCETWIHCFTFDQLKILYGGWSQCVLIRLYITAQWNLKLELTFSYYIAVSVARGDLPSNLVSYSPGQIVHGISKWPRLDSQIFELSSAWWAGMSGVSENGDTREPNNVHPRDRETNLGPKIYEMLRKDFYKWKLSRTRKSESWNWWTSDAEALFWVWNQISQWNIFLGIHHWHLRTAEVNLRNCNYFCVRSFKTSKSMMLPNLSVHTWWHTQRNSILRFIRLCHANSKSLTAVYCSIHASRVFFVPHGSLDLKLESTSRRTFNKHLNMQQGTSACNFTIFSPLRS